MGAGSPLCAVPPLSLHSCVAHVTKEMERYPNTGTWPKHVGFRCRSYLVSFSTLQELVFYHQSKFLVSKKRRESIFWAGVSQIGRPLFTQWSAATSPTALRKPITPLLPSPSGSFLMGELILFILFLIDLSRRQVVGRAEVDTTKQLTLRTDFVWSLSIGLSGMIESSASKIHHVQSFELRKHSSHYNPVRCSLVVMRPVFEIPPNCKVIVAFNSMVCITWPLVQNADSTNGI